jgi:hypothetical protein
LRLPRFAAKTGPFACYKSNGFSSERLGWMKLSTTPSYWSNPVVHFSTSMADRRLLRRVGSTVIRQTIVTAQEQVVAIQVVNPPCYPLSPRLSVPFLRHEQRSLKVAAPQTYEQ